MSHWLTITSGTGPDEVRRFVALLAARLERRAIRAGLVVRRREVRGEARAPRSVAVLLEGAAEAVLGAERGSHALVARSPARDRHSRKRWFAAVTLVEAIDRAGPAGPSLRAEDLRVRACRAGGPGGQNVNKRSTAVRLLHLPTGTTVRADDQRGQVANRRRAEARLRDRLAARATEADRQAGADRRLMHYRLERGAPVRTYRLDVHGDLEETS
jgi:putative peptide chain release factor H